MPEIILVKTEEYYSDWNGASQIITQYIEGFTEVTDDELKLLRMYLSEDYGILVKCTEKELTESIAYCIKKAKEEEEKRLALEKRKKESLTKAQQTRARNELEKKKKLLAKLKEELGDND